MTGGTGPKYLAFLSYSHRDQEFGEALHRALEDYPIPPDLIGTPGVHGAVPAKLRPIFRDRFDLEAGPSLRDQVTSALADSQALIVVCSPASAKSLYVNEEIRQFKALGRADRIYPLIIDGEPGDAERECFAPALRHVVDGDGRITAFLEEPLAADWRETGDGPELARLKLICGLIGVDLDRLRRREVEAQRRQKRFWIGIAAAMGVLAIFALGASGVAYLQREEKKAALVKSENLLDATLERTSSLVSSSVSNVQRNGLPARIGLDLLKEVQGFFDDMDRIEASSPKLPLRRGEMLIGLSSSYRQLGLGEEALDYARLAKRLLAEEVAAREADGRAIEDRLQYQLASAYMHVARGQTDRRLHDFARASSETALAIADRELAGANAKSPQWLSLRGDLLLGLAHIHALRQDWDQASRHAASAREVARKLGDLGHTREAARSLALALIQIADIDRSRGETEKALASSLEAEDTVRLAIRLHPDDILWKSRLYHLLVVRADISRDQGKLEAALQSYQAAQAVVEPGYRRDPHNAAFAAQFAFSNVKISETANRLGQLPLSETAVGDACEAYEKLIEGDPQSGRYTGPYLDALESLGEVQRRLGKTDEMAATHERRLKRVLTLLDIDPANPSLLRHAATSSFMAGEAHKMRGRSVKAREKYETALTYRQRQIDAGSDSTGNRFEFAWAIVQIGHTFSDKGQFAAALPHYRRAIELMEPLAPQFDPGSYNRSRYIATVESVANALANSGEPHTALEWFDKVLDLRVRLAQANPTYANRRALTHAREMIAAAWFEAGDVAKAHDLYEAAVTNREDFLAEEPADAQRRRNLANSLKVLAETKGRLGDCTTADRLLARAAEEMQRAIADHQGAHGEDRAGWPEQLLAIEALRTSMAAACPGRTG